MTANQPATDPDQPEAPLSWREIAVARSLDPARARAEIRVQRFLDAATELMNNSPERDFTVQEVVERSGQSLRSFYQYFAGKYELLLALFEESVRTTAEHLRTAVDAEKTPLDQLHRFTVEYCRLCQPAAKGKPPETSFPAMPEFAQQLLTEHPKEAARAYVPVVTILVELLDAAEAAGSIRSGMHHRRAAGTILQSIMFQTFALTISGSSRPNSSEAGEELWELIIRGIAA